MAKKQFKLYFIIGLLVLMTGCSLKTRHADRGSSTTISPNPKPGLILKSEENKPADNEFPALTNSTTSSPSGSQLVALPKFGFIFSGGGAKAWAHIEFL